MKIIIDTYGVDDGIKIPIEGAISALKEKDFVPVFSGDKEKIEKIIDGRIKSYEIIDAKDKIENNEDPVKAIRRKKDSTMVKAFEKLNEDGYDGLVSAGSTGAILASGLFISGRIKGIKRACIATSLPTYENTTFIIGYWGKYGLQSRIFKRICNNGKCFCKKCTSYRKSYSFTFKCWDRRTQGKQISKRNLQIIGGIFNKFQRKY